MYKIIVREQYGSNERKIHETVGVASEWRGMIGEDMIYTTLSKMSRVTDM